MVVFVVIAIAVVFVVLLCEKPCLFVMKAERVTQLMQCNTMEHAAARIQIDLNIINNHVMFWSLLGKFWSGLARTLLRIRSL